MREVIFNYVDPALLQIPSSATFVPSYKAVRETKPDPLKAALVKVVLEDCRAKKDGGSLPSPALALRAEELSQLGK